MDMKVHVVWGTDGEVYHFDPPLDLDRVCAGDHILCFEDRGLDLRAYGGTLRCLLRDLGEQVAEAWWRRVERPRPSKRWLKRVQRIKGKG